MLRPHRVVLAVGVLLVGPAALSAQSYAQQVWDQLQVHYKAVAKTSDDWILTNYIMGHLRGTAIESWTFTLVKGKEYIVTGACDNDCTNVDLTLTDPDDKVVAEDTKDDDTPVLVLRADRDGTYTIAVSIKACKESPCYYGFGLFTK